MFRVMEHVIGAGPAQGPKNWRVVQDGITELAIAEAIASGLSKQFDVNGYNEENNHWWGRNTGGNERRVYHVESSGI